MHTDPRLVHDGATRGRDHPVEIERDRREDDVLARLQEGRRDRADERLRAVRRHDEPWSHPE